jgi:small subunit ribosomal protein S16
MLAIKLRNVGKKHQRSFRIVVQERRSKLQGKFVEDLGWWSPRSDKAEIKNDRAAYWVSVGAQPSETVRQLLKKYKIGNTKPGQ